MTDQESTTTSEASGTSQEEATKRLNKRRIGYAWNDYFMNKDDGEVWVQNVTDMQISLDIETAPGQTEGHLVPPSPDPENLTEKYAFEVLKKSSNFRKTLAKRLNGTPQLILLDPEQVEAYYAAKARAMGAVDATGTPNIDAALDAAEQTRKELTTRATEGADVNATNLHGFAPPKSAQELIAMDLSNRGMYAGGHAFGQHAMSPDQHNAAVQQKYAQQGVPANMQQGMLYVEEIVNPKVMHLCQQVNPQIPESQRMPAEQFFRALQSMQANLKIHDYQYIESHGTYRTVKAWARQKLSETSGAAEGLPDNLSLAGHQQVSQAEQQGALQAVPMPQGMGPQPVASLTQQGTQYQGPQGFANAPFQEMAGAGQSMAGSVLGPDGQPLGG